MLTIMTYLSIIVLLLFGLIVGLIFRWWIKFMKQLEEQEDLEEEEDYENDETMS